MLYSLRASGRYNDAVGLEHTLNEAIKTIEIPVTILCLYNSIPADLEDRLSEYHDIIIKRTSGKLSATGN